MSTILSSDTLIGSYTQQALSDQWVKQANSTPIEENPFFTDDLTNRRGRRGSVELNTSFQAASPEGTTILGGFLDISGGPEAPEMPLVRTIIGQSGTTYFAPFANQIVDNTTPDPINDFHGNYPLTPQHLSDLGELEVGDPSNLLGAEIDAGKTLLDVVNYVADHLMGKQFIMIDGVDMTPDNIGSYKQATENVGYAQLPRSTGAIYPSDTTFLVDPDLRVNKDEFLKLSDLDPQLVPFVQAGYYFAFTLDSGSHTIEFGDRKFGQNTTYNILNPIYGTDKRDHLCGTVGNDYIDGGGENDRLLGLAGDDLLVGGRGNDIIDGGKGDDELWGDEGSDTFIFKRGYGQDMIYDFSPEDKLNIRGLNVSCSGISPVELPGGLSTAINFGRGDVLTLVGIEESQLRIHNGFVTLV